MELEGRMRMAPVHICLFTKSFHFHFLYKMYMFLTTCYFLVPTHNYTLCSLEGQLCPQDRAKIHQKKKTYHHGSSFEKEEYESKDKEDG